MDHEAKREDKRTGATIRALRLAYGASIDELASAAGGISPRLLYYIEKGERHATLAVCKKIAGALRVPLIAITSGDPDGEAERKLHRARTDAA